MWVIDSKELPAVGGFDIRVEVLPDTDIDPRFEYDCYSEADINAWVNGDWQYTSIRVVASKLGHDLGEAWLGGCERGWFPSGCFVDPLLDNDYIEVLLAEAVNLAVDELSKLTEV